MMLFTESGMRWKSIRISCKTDYQFFCNNYNHLLNRPLGISTQDDFWLFVL